MPVFSLKCPNCGSKIDFQEEGRASTCKACGVKSFFEKNGGNVAVYLVDATTTTNNYIQSATIIAEDAQDNYNNFAELMKQADKAGNYNDCHKYASRILEKNPKNATAWFFKGLSSGYKSSLASFSSKEIITCYENAIKYSQGKEKSNIIWYSSRLIKLANNFIEQSREHAIEFGRVEGAGQDHINDIRQISNMLIQVYKLSNNKEALKAIVAMTANHDDLKSIYRETMKVLEGVDPEFFKQQNDEKGFDRTFTCGCGVIILLIVGIPLFFFLRTIKW